MFWNWIRNYALLRYRHSKLLWIISTTLFLRSPFSDWTVQMNRMLKNERYRKVNVDVLWNFHLFDGWMWWQFRIQRLSNWNLPEFFSFCASLVDVCDGLMDNYASLFISRHETREKLQVCIRWPFLLNTNFRFISSCNANSALALALQSKSTKQSNITNLFTTHLFIEIEIGHILWEI